MTPFVNNVGNYANCNHVEQRTNGERVCETQHVSRPRERGSGAQRNSRTESKHSPIRLRKSINARVNTQKHSQFVDKGRKVKVPLSKWNTILANICGKTVSCLIDTGASINLVNCDWLIANIPENTYRLEKPRVNSARVANGTDMPIMGFVTLPIKINNHTFVEVPFNVARGLAQTMILGSKFLNKHGAIINCRERTVILDKISQLRVVQKQEIPAHSQSIIHAKLSNKIPVNVMGVGQGGRQIAALGIMVANSTSVVLENNCAYILVMNATNEPIILYPRTKLGTFTLIDPSRVQHFDKEDDSVDLVNFSNEVDDSVDPRVKEVLTKVNVNTDHLSKEQETGLKDLLSEYVDVFQVEGGPRGHYAGVKHEIFTDNHPPIRSRPYRQTPYIQAEVRRQIKEMLDQDIIKESTSPWSFPVCMIPKAGTDTYRFCVDFRKLNSICARNNFPLPNINDTLDSLGVAKPKYFSTLDLAAGYWQIDLEESSKPKTAFITQDGLYQFQRLPFGLHNAPATFQRAMQEVLRGLNWKFVLVYLDDVILFSSNFEEHLVHLRQVLERFRSVGLKLQPKNVLLVRKRSNILAI